MRAGRVRKLALERIDGEPAIGCPLASTLVELGFHSGPRQLTLSAMSRSSASWRDAEPPLTPPRVGHKGAAHIEPGNTLASFDAALAQGVDMIEFDVLSEHPDGSGRLLVAHDYEDMRSRIAAQPEEALEHLAGRRSPGIELDVDIKLPGYELRVLAALREFGPVERTLVSGMFPDELARSARRSRRCAWAGRCRGCGATTPPTCSPRSPRWRSSPATGRCCPAAPARR